MAVQEDAVILIFRKMSIVVVVVVSEITFLPSGTQKFAHRLDIKTAVLIFC